MILLRLHVILLLLLKIHLILHLLLLEKLRILILLWNLVIWLKYLRVRSLLYTRDHNILILHEVLLLLLIYLRYLLLFLNISVELSLSLPVLPFKRIVFFFVSPNLVVSSTVALIIFFLNTPNFRHELVNLFFAKVKHSSAHRFCSTLDWDTKIDSLSNLVLQLNISVFLVTVVL